MSTFSGLNSTINWNSSVSSTFVPNITSSTPSKWPYLPLQPKQGLILFLITLPGAVANIIAFLTTLKLIRGKRSGLAPNYLILALNATDFYGIVFCTLPTLLCYLRKDWVGGMTTCNFQGVSTMFASLASGCLATSMAVERLFAVWKPFIYRETATVKKATLTILVIWSTTFIIAIIPLSRSGNFVRNLTGTFCTINWFAKNTENVAYAIFYALIGVTLLIIVVFCNVQLALFLLNVGKSRKHLKGHSSMKKLMKHDSNPDVNLKKDTSKSTSVMERQLAKTVALISLLFFICWAPFMIRIICNLTGVWVDAWADVQVSRLLLLNFVLDPFLYTLSRKQCRDILKGWFCCCCPKGKSYSLFSKFHVKGRKKHGTFISSSQTGSGSNVNTTTSSIPMHQLKNSADCTPAQSTENSIADVVVTAVSTEKTPVKDEEVTDGANETTIQAHSDSTSPENQDSGASNTHTASTRHHSESGNAPKSTLSKEKTHSVPDLTEVSKDKEVEVNVAYMYDLAFQRQSSN